VASEAMLDVEIPLEHVRRLVVGVDRERSRERRQAVEAREHRVCRLWRRHRRIQSKVSVERRHKPCELQFVQIQVVVVHAKSAADYRAACNLIRNSYAWRKVV